MIEQLKRTLADITKQYSDTRIQHCQVEANQGRNGSILLTGSVLDGETLSAIAKELSGHFPSADLDISGVEVLRQARPTLLTVITNIASLYAQTSSLSERVSQLLNGWTVEQLKEVKDWVYTRQSDGYLGWVYRPYLHPAPAPQPTHIIHQPVSLLRQEPDEQSAIVGRALAGMRVAVDANVAGYGQLTLVGGLTGWVPVGDLRALSDIPSTEAEMRQQMVEDSLKFVGVPYLWGGISGFGIDCSGFVRLLYSLAGVQIPRDADMQYDVGRPVEPPFQPGDLLFFGSGQSPRSITHVGMSLGGWRTIHSSGPRNGVYFDDVQAVSWLNDRFIGARTFADR
jgi:cell wall-associated NlpC family hydrolase